MEFVMNPLESDSGSPYRIPTHPIEARLVLSNGKREVVTLFLASASKSHPGPESMDEFLNRLGQFLPVRWEESDQSRLVNRDVIQRVEVNAETPVPSVKEGKQATHIDLIRVEMADGSFLEGTLPYVVSPQNPRVSDFINQPQIFFSLQIGSEIVYVNKRFVTSIDL
jgi:hypothetical protein